MTAGVQVRREQALGLGDNRTERDGGVDHALRAVATHDRRGLCTGRLDREHNDAQRRQREGCLDQTHGQIFVFGSTRLPTNRACAEEPTGFVAWTWYAPHDLIVNWFLLYGKNLKMCQPTDFCSGLFVK